MATKEENKRYRDKLKYDPKSITKQQYWIRRRFDNLVQKGIIVPEIEE